MLARLRARLTYANVVATLALFLALGGASYAAVRVGSAGIVNNSVRSEDLRNNDVRSKDIRNRTIVGRDVLANSITGPQIRESSLAKVPNADNLDGQDSSAFKVGCPSGTRRHGGGCIEEGARGAQTVSSASRVCASQARRLPLYSELESFRQEPGINLANGSDYELTASTYGSPTVTLGLDDAGNRFEIPYATAKQYRCVAPLSN